MATKTWPVYHAHDEAYCFNCGGDWRDGAYPMLSGYAKGSGEWFQVCNKCGLETFYDLDRVNFKDD